MIPLRNPRNAATRFVTSKASSMPAAERDVNYWIQRAGSHCTAKENPFFTVRLTNSQVSFTAGMQNEFEEGRSNRVSGKNIDGRVISSVRIHHPENHEINWTRRP
jgi:hypothetical protein